MSQSGISNPLVPMTGGAPVAGIVFIQGYHLQAYAIGLLLGIFTFLIFLISKFKKKGLN